MKQKPLIIAIDGYSSCGKSTFAKAIAQWLHYTPIDSGAMYRTVTLYALKEGYIQKDKLDKEKLIKVLPQITIEFRGNPAAGKTETYLNGQIVEKEIRNIDVSKWVSEVSKIKEVRKHLVRLQRQLAGHGGVTMDGRDIGTVVFPDADIKIFMTASPEIRAKRRYKELLEKGENVTFEEVLTNIKSRDEIDSGRDVSPLRAAPDALILDNSQMTVKEQMLWIKDIIRKKRNEQEEKDED